MAPRSAGFGDDVAEQAFADTGAAGRFRHGHLCQLIFAGGHGQQGAAADRFAVAQSEEDSAAAVEDCPAGLGQDFFVLGFERELADDPFFIQAAKGVFVAGKELADGYVDETGIHLASMKQIYGKSI